MITIREIATGKEYQFESNPDAAKFLGITYGSLYYKFNHQSTNDGYLITQFDKNCNNFKRYKDDKFNIEFFENTSIITWSEKVDSDFDLEFAIKGQKQAVLGILKKEMIFHTKHILLGQIQPLPYTKLPPEKVTWELYVNFRDEGLSKKEKKTLIKEHLLPFLQSSF